MKMTRSIMTYYFEPLIHCFAPGRPVCRDKWHRTPMPGEQKNRKTDHSEIWKP